MEKKSVEPLDTGQRSRRRNRGRYRQKLAARLRSGWTIRNALWMATSIVKLVHLIYDLFDGS